MKKFAEFMRKEGAVGLAAGFIVGGAISSFVEVFIRGVLDPLVASLFNTSAFWNKSEIIGEGADAVQVSWGATVVLLVNVLIVMGVVYGFARWMGYIKSDKKK